MDKEDLTMFRWDGENRLFDKIISVLDDHIKNANNYVTMAQQADSERSFHAGSLSEAGDIKDHLMDLKSQANNTNDSLE